MKRTRKAVLTVMKKTLLILAALLMLALTGAALADEAVNLTAECTFKTSYSGKKATTMTDNKYTTKWESKKSRNPSVAITAPAGQPIYGLYICLATMPQSYEIQVEQNGKWVKYCDGNTDYYHNYVSIPEGTNKVRLYVTQSTQMVLGINEIFCFGQGDLPSWVQLWEPTETNVDLLLFVAHPDDELLFFSGILPTYAIERGYKTAVAYLCYSNTTRRSEILNGLWTIGIRNYPIIGTFSDHFDATLADAYKYAGGKTKVYSYVTRVIRQTKPKVIMTHSEAGEYGHKQHQMIADAVKACVEFAADETQCPESIPEYGTWKASKVYLHEYSGSTQITYDWSVALNAYGGLNAIDVAQQGYNCHVTQRAAGFVLTTDGVVYKKQTYNNNTYGLYQSEVGADTVCEDVMENIYLEDNMLAVARPTATPAPTARPAYLDVTPELNEKGFLNEGEFYSADDTKGLYVYVDSTKRIVVERKNDPTLKLTWFEAEIWSDVEAGEHLKTAFYDEEKRGKVRVDAAENAIKHKAVFAMNTDYYTYRISSPRHIGVVIRNGVVLYDDPIKKETDLFPNLDTVAFYPDGRLEVAHSYEHGAQYFIDNGAENVFSFGPYLIRDGEVNPAMYGGRNLKYKNPRCAIGMVEPGHYVCILAEGRLKRSGGVTMNQLALMMKSKGCTQAINLDGGQTAVMCFMGKQLNLIGAYNGKTSARETCDIMYIGVSDIVGQAEFK